MVPPLLKLVFLKGPREGETLEFKPGSNVRVGRIVRGNDLAIKDAGISTKHFRIDSESEKWTIQDLGSSNGTALNTTTLPADTPFDLHHGDTIKLGEYTSIMVNFEIDVQDNETVQEHKLPPRPKRNNRRQAVVELDPVGSVKENPTRKGRSTKQGNAIIIENDDEQEIPRRGRVSRSKIAENTVVEVPDLEEKDEKKVNSRVTRTRKNKGLGNSCLDGEKAAIADRVKEEVMEEERQGKKGNNSRVRRSRKIESTQSSCLDSGDMEMVNIPKEEEVSEVREENRVNRRSRRGKKIETKQNSCSEVSNVEIVETKSESAFEVSKNQDGNRVKQRVTRSKKNEIFRDSYMELEMVESQARRLRAGKKKKQEKPLESVEPMLMEDHKDINARISVLGKGIENEEDTGLFEEHRYSIDAKYCSEAANERCEEGTEKNALGEEGEIGTVREETEDLQNMGLLQECQGTIDKGRSYGTTEASGESSDRRDDEKGTIDLVEVELGKMTLGQWFDFLEIHLPKQIIDETEKMIAPMRSKSQRVYEYIVEQKNVKGKRPME